MLKYVFISTLYISGIPVPFVQIYITVYGRIPNVDNDGH